MAFFNKLSSYGGKREANLRKCNVHKTAHWLAGLTNGTSTETFERPEQITGIRAKHPHVPLQVETLEFWTENWTFFCRVKVAGATNVQCRVLLLEPADNDSPGSKAGGRRKRQAEKAGADAQKHASSIMDIHAAFRGSTLECSDAISYELAAAPEFDDWLDHEGQMTVEIHVGQREQPLRFPSARMRCLVVVND